MKVREIIDGCALWKPSQDYETAKPIVSVLLPTFRRAKSGLFEAAVKSVLNQTQKELELIIIDDASTDGTEDLIRGFMEQDARVSCIRHQYNVGLPAISEYEAYRKARGEYIAFIFDNNVWEPDYLSSTIDFMVKNQAKASYGRIRFRTSTSDEYLEIGSSANNNLGIHALAYTNYIGNGGVVLAREVLETVGLYDPHVIMTRTCDWSLWKRIVKKYKFYETGILAGEEKGLAQNDSLGNSYKMDHWAVAERESQVTDEMLLPERFEDVEIDRIAPCSSEFYCEATDSFYRFFENKPWYIPAAQRVPEKTPCRILVLVSEYNATTDLAFLRMKNAGGQLVFLFGASGMSEHQILQADAVILVRDVLGLDHYKKLCKKLNIPCLLYQDDNFILLAEDYKENASFQQMKEYLSEEQLNEYTCLLCSTPALTDFYKGFDLDIPVHTLQPCIGQVQPQNLCCQEEPYVFAYMGGPFRDEMFLQAVMPAICKLAEKHSVKVLCPSRLKMEEYRQIRGMEIVEIPLSLSLEEALLGYAHHNPHILLHCGPEIRNNAYKTENAMINATQIGAVLVASDVSNYIEQDGVCCACAENTPEAWYAVITDLLSDTEKVQRIYKNARKHCMDQYDPKKNVLVLADALSDLKPAGMYELLRRSDEFVHDALKNNYRGNRLLGRIPLSYTGDLEKDREYRIVCRNDIFSQLGICFASFGNPSGKVTIEIYDAKRRIRESSLKMNRLQWNNWSYFSFTPIENARDRVFDIVIKFQYDEGSARIGVFEEDEKRSFLYRLLNKLGIRLKIQNLLYADFR